MLARAPRLVVLALAVGTLVAGTIVLGTESSPYVVTAIDYHFHDAHPTFPIVPGRDLVVSNQGRNVHNVSIPALGVSRNVAPGERITIRNVGGRLEPGRYLLFCRYHRTSFGMVGVIVIAGG